MFKKRSSKHKVFVIPQNEEEREYYDHTSNDTQAAPTTSLHPLKPTITLPLFDDEDFVLSRNKNMKKKSSKMSRASTEFSKSLPVHKSPDPSDQKVTQQPILLQGAFQQTPTCTTVDMSNELKENSLLSPLHKTILNSCTIDPHSHCYYLLSSIDRLKKNEKMNAYNFRFSTDSDEETWEYEQLARTNNLPKSMSSIPKESYHQQDSFMSQNKPETTDTISSHSFRNSNTFYATFDRVTHSLNALNDQLTTYECQLDAVKKKYEQALQDQHEARHSSCDPQICEADSQEFHDFQKIFLWFQNISEYILEKSEAVRLANEALNKLEKEEFQFLNEEDAKLYPSLSSLNLVYNNSKITPILETAQTNMTNSPTNDILSDTVSRFKNQQDTSNVSQHKLQALTYKREKFFKGVLDIFQHVNEEFLNLDLIATMYLNMLKKYPFLLHEECFISALQTIVTFVMRYKLLLWNPILPVNSSNAAKVDQNETFFLTPSYKCLSSMTSQLEEMINEHECPTCLQKGLSPLVNHNFVAYVIFEILLCRVTRWVSQCWTPLSLTQSKKLGPILFQIVTNDTKRYAKAVVTLKTLVYKQFQDAATSYCVLQDIDTLNSDKAIACLMNATLLCDIIISFYEKILSEDHFRCLIVNTVYDNYKRLRTSDISTIPFPVKSHFRMLTQGLPSFLLSFFDEETKNFIKQLL